MTVVLKLATWLAIIASAWLGIATLLWLAIVLGEYSSGYTVTRRDAWAWWCVLVQWPAVLFWRVGL